VVLDSYTVLMLPDGTRLSRTHIVVQPRTQEAKDNLGMVGAPRGAVVYELRGVRPDGTILMPEPVEGSGGLTIPGLEVGDFVERDYVEYDDRPLSPALRFEDATFMFVAPQMPTWRSRFTAIHPLDRPVAYHLLNTAMQPVVREENGQRILQWLTADLPRFVPEPDMPERDATMPAVYFYLPASWDELRRWQADGLAYRFRPSAELSAFAREHTRPEMDAETKARALYQAVQRRVRGFQSNSYAGDNAARVLGSRQGSRLLLLKALCDIVGVRSRFVSYRPNHETDVGYRAARYGVYGSNLLEVTTPTGRFYLDGNFEHSRFGLIPPEASGARALVLDDGPVAFLTLPTVPPNPRERSTRLALVIDTDGATRGEVEETADGYFAAPYRMQLKDAAPEDIQQYYEAFFNRTFPNTRLPEVKVENLDDAAKPVVLRYGFTSRGYARPLLGRLVIARPTVPFLVGQLYVAKVDRQFPLVIRRPRALTERYEITPPPGWKPEALPENGVLAGPFGRFSVEYSYANGKIVIEKTLVVPSQRVRPGEEYNRFLKFVTDIDRLDGRPLALVPQAQPTAANDR